MIKTKTALLIFVFLALIVFPYYIIFLQSDFLSSLIPSWNTSIQGGRIIMNLIKFIIITIVIIFYFKLSKIQFEINFKQFIIHFLLTFPAVLVSVISLYDLLNFHSVDLETFVKQIRIIIWANSLINLLFFIGQIYFFFWYKKSFKQLT